MIDSTMSWIESTATPVPFSITNDGANIATTDYWETDAAKDGICFLSEYERTLRLLVPDKIVDQIRKETKRAKRVSVETSIANPFCIDIVFHEASRPPFWISADRRFIELSGSTRRNVALTLWTRRGKIRTLPAVVEAIEPFPVMRASTSRLEAFLKSLKAGKNEY